MVTDWINDWIRELLINAITANLSNLFDTVNDRVGEIAAEVGMTPAAWNGGISLMDLADAIQREKEKPAEEVKPKRMSIYEQLRQPVPQKPSVPKPPKRGGPEL